MCRVRGRTVTRDTAVVLMAYGSPSRLEDVPAYYQDIRGGRPVSQEAIDRLVARYQRVGISPLNEITEAQRSGLEQELELPVFVGMKHWQPRIADAAGEALAQRRDEGRRARARAPLLRAFRSAATATGSRRRSTGAPSFT